MKELIKKRKLNITIMWIICALVNIKSAFTNYVLDTGYAFTLGYRRLLGDDLFGYMREPHQTSAFFISMLMRIYSKIFPDLSGIVIVTNICSIAIYAVVAALLVKLLSSFVSESDANILGAVFFIFRPKIIQTFEYSNMVVVFSTLLFISISYHFIDQREKSENKTGLLKYKYIYCSALCICLSVLSYPSTLLLYIVISILLFAFADEKWACFGRMTGFCVVFGLAYFIYILNGRSIGEFIEILAAIFNNDSHSTANIYTGLFYWVGILLAFGMLLVSAILALMTSFIANKIKRNSGTFIVFFSVFYAAFIFVEKFVLNTLGDYYQIGSWSLHFAFVLIPVVIGINSFSKLQSDERTLCIAGLSIGTMTVLSVVILTNLPLHTALGYGVVVAIASSIPIIKRFGLSARAVTICMLVILICGSSTTDLRSINYIRKGPLKYIVAPIEQCNMYKISYDEWNANVNSDDVVFIPQTFGFDATFYMYTKAGVGAASTISTPYYGELLDRYWKEYPEKEPTVMAVFAWDGNERMDVPEWLIEKINNEYEITDSEEYWNFYRKK